MKKTLIFTFFFSLMSPVFSADEANSNTSYQELTKRIGLLTLRVKEERHRSIVYRQLRFPDRFTQVDLEEMVKLDEEICKLQQTFTEHFKLEPIGKPIGDEKTIIQELCKKYYGRPHWMNLKVSYDNKLPKEYFPIEMIFIADQEASRSILISSQVDSLPNQSRQLGHKSLRLPCDWSILEETYTEWTHEGPKRRKLDNLLQKNKSIFQKDRYCTDANYIELDCNSLFQAGSKFPSLKALEGGKIECTAIFPLVMYCGVDEPGSLSYSIMFKTQDDCFYLDRFGPGFGVPSSYTLKENKFI